MKENVGHRRPTAYRAPSWSWAAVDGAVSYDSVSFQCGLDDGQNFVLTEIIECWVTLEDALLSFCRVTGGTLVLRGTPIPQRGKHAQKFGPGGRWLVSPRSFEQAQLQQ